MYIKCVKTQNLQQKSEFTVSSHIQKLSILQVGAHENDIIITSVRRKTVHFVHIFGISIIPPFFFTKLVANIAIISKNTDDLFAKPKNTPTQIL